MRFYSISSVLLIVCYLTSSITSGQQIIDSLFLPKIDNPSYAAKQGPLVLVDAYHNNGSTLESGFSPVANVLEKDGYILSSLNGTFKSEYLINGDILVIIDALHYSNVDNWELPTPSAFDDLEIAGITNWVKGGGNLLLVADHMPFPGASRKLAKNFGVDWINGFVIDSIQWNLIEFRRDNATLINHAIIEGRNKNENLDLVASYYGSGFKITDSNVRGLFSFNNKNTVSYQTRKAWKMSANTPTVSSDNLYQAAAIEYGKGRVIVVGESSLFSAQLVGKDRNPIGINYKENSQNLQFVLNVFHWLSRLIN